MRNLVQRIASTLYAYKNCIETKNAEWEPQHLNQLLNDVRERMPSGSGIDCGTHMDVDGSEPNRLVFTTSFHHMNEVGMYDGWTDHTIIVTPCLISGIDVQVTGRDRNDIKEYLGEVFREALT